jgi:hypothetical protein
MKLRLTAICLAILCGIFMIACTGIDKKNNQGQQGGNTGNASPQTTPSTANHQNQDGNSGTITPQTGNSVYSPTPRPTPDPAEKFIQKMPAYTTGLIWLI